MSDYVVRHLLVQPITGHLYPEPRIVLDFDITAEEAFLAGSESYDNIRLSMSQLQVDSLLEHIDNARKSFPSRS